MAGKPSRKIEESLSESCNEFTPPVPPSPAVRRKAAVAANKERKRMAEKKRRNRNDYTIQVSPKRKLGNMATRTAKKIKITSETGNESTSETPAKQKENTPLEPVKESYPTPLSYIPRLGPRGEAPAEKNEATVLETDSASVLTQLKTLKTIEESLVYTDEDISFEFAEPVVSTSTQSACHGSTLPNINILFQINLNQARACYRHQKYAAAVEHFSKALELCNRGISTEDPVEASANDISSIASFIETKLAMCYLKMKRPSDALTHAHRSISKNPTHFQNHMRQAAAFRSLGRYSEAARSAMIADYIYWLKGGTDLHTSKYIRCYWQAMIEEAITTELSFSVMYTPFQAEEKHHSIISKIQRTFAEKNSEYLQYHYTDHQEFHILPESTQWLSGSPRLHFLTLGFRNKSVGKLVEKWTTTKLSMLSDRNAPFNTLKDKKAEKYWKIIGQNVMSAMDFRRSTKLTDNRCPCSRAIEKLQQASLFGRMQNLQQRDQLLEQVLAEIATLPYLQDINEEDNKPLLMANVMETLGGRTDNLPVWNEIPKIGLLEGYIYEAEDSYIKNEMLKEARTERRKKTQSSQHAQSPRNVPRSTPGITPQRTLQSTQGSTPQSRLRRMPESTLQSRPRRTSGNTPQRRSQRISGSRAQGTAGIAPELLSLIQPCSIVLEPLEFPPHTSGR